MSVRWPDFLVIGAQKAGTSWLHVQLRRLAAVWMPDDKDFEYFSYPGDHPAERYLARFDGAPASAIVGDACASYFWTTGHGPDNRGFAPDLAAAIDAVLGPSARYIVLLRDPVERTLSAYLHHIAHGSLDPRVSLLEAPRALGLVEISRYGTHLDRWLDVVPADRICVLPAPGEAAAADVLRGALGFLGVDDPPPADVASTVFPGLRRRSTEDGLWVPVEPGGVAAPVGPVMTDDGERWTRVVSAETRAAVAAQLAPEVNRLAATLERIGQRSPVFERWSSWSASA